VAGVSDQQLGIDLKQEGPDYRGIAKAAADGKLFTAKMEKAAA
jgi:hypothetical protein